MSVISDPDPPPVPDPVAYWRAMTGWLEDQTRRYETPPITRWMEDGPWKPRR